MNSHNQQKENVESQSDTQRAPAGEQELGQSTAPKKKRDKPPEDDMTYQVATNHDQVVASWALVYKSYLGIGLIDENMHELHCSHQAAHEDSIIVYGKVQEDIVCTLTIINDDPQLKLPLDVVYHEHLDDLRSQGKELVEISLLADRRKKVTRTLHSLYAMMRYVFHYAYKPGKIIVIGVHPRHARFYQSSFGFEMLGDETTHPTVKDNPVVYLELDLQKQMALENPPKQLLIYDSQPLKPGEFEDRYCFKKDYDEDSLIRAYLDKKYHTQSQKDHDPSDLAA